MVREALWAVHAAASRRTRCGAATPCDSELTYRPPRVTPATKGDGGDTDSTVPPRCPHSACSDLLALARVRGQQRLPIPLIAASRSWAFTRSSRFRAYRTAPLLRAIAAASANTSAIVDSRHRSQKSSLCAGDAVTRGRACSKRLSLFSALAFGLVFRGVLGYTLRCPLTGM